MVNALVLLSITHANVSTASTKAATDMLRSGAPVALSPATITEVTSPETTPSVTTGTPV